MWILPALIAAAQIVYWPVLPLLRDDPVPAGGAAVVVAATLVTAAGLGLRRQRPLHALGVVVAGITVGTLAAPDGQYLYVDGDAVLIIAVADMIALFSVAVREPARTTLLAVAGLAIWQSVVTWEGPFGSIVMAGVYAVVAAFGRVRGRWNSDRAAAVLRLEAARQAHREAADAERRRLARELHDVTAHHLTSVVVNAQAAQLLGDQRPELRDEALRFAARTGRDTLGALRRLVTIMPAGSEVDETVPTLSELAQDFSTLGQQLTLSLPDGEPPADIAEAMHGIAREALTNTLRYAPGGSVTLHFGYAESGAELVVEDRGPGAESTGATGLGGGRGVTGMRERAAALGGTLRAGPRTQGGWEVRAHVPRGVPGAAGRRFRRLAASRGVLDAGLILLVLLLPLGGLASEVLPATVWWLVLAAMIAHAAPLWWRRRFPWQVLGAVIATAWLGPLLYFTGVVPQDLGWLFLFSAGAELVAVHAAGDHGGRPGLTWIAPAVTVLSVLALATMMGAGSGGFVAMVLLTGVFTVLVSVVLGPLMFASWWSGVATRRRRELRRHREEGGVALAMAGAEAQALAERTRIADGLRADVLRHAAELPEAAERGDLNGVLGAARQALTAMRSLLDGMSSSSSVKEEVPSSLSGS
ncbi:signal transduction histidine kinase [Actinoplanes lutulentus]|uniref:histidine kinase n=1 Tax=Actinoplanes lutulentus TaxID=1287878 RepID=A0A327YX41_9ACTN|nr:histidine kinase [Actinoplanes lutulentus]MBB2947548.1 signal transduction histidine kinase [Actinoplanes lutulentus]RAK25704.1 signal transduction histidine kinase [Actinoplanes lutulentus]